MLNDVDRDIDGRLVLVTGASGFIGARVCERLLEAGARVRVLSRRALAYADCVVGDICDAAVIERAVASVHTIVHAAGYAHAFDANNAADAALHERTNFLATRDLAAAAAKAGVRRIVLCSSVKAVGEPGEQCVDESFDAPPLTPYGIAKLKAEQALLACVRERTGMEAVIMRLSMVYGPSGRGNLERMMRLVARGWFPPLPETGNHRSMVFIDDAVEALMLGAFHPAAAGRTFIVAHPEAPSGREILQAMRRVCGKREFRWAVPAPVLRGAGRLADCVSWFSGRRVPLDSQAVSRLLESSWYSSARVQTELGWQPRICLAEGLAVSWAADGGPATPVAGRQQQVVQSKQ